MRALDDLATPSHSILALHQGEHARMLAPGPVPRVFPPGRHENPRSPRCVPRGGGRDVGSGGAVPLAPRHSPRWDHGNGVCRGRGRNTRGCITLTTENNSHVGKTPAPSCTPRHSRAPATHPRRVVRRRVIQASANSITQAIAAKAATPRARLPPPRSRPLAYGGRGRATCHHSFWLAEALARAAMRASAAAARRARRVAASSSPPPPRLAWAGLPPRAGSRPPVCLRGECREGALTVWDVQDGAVHCSWLAVKMS